MARLTDSHVLEALRAKDDGVLTAVVRENTPALYAAALGLGFPETEAEELVQAVFAAFLEGVERFEGRSTVRTFLFGILYRKAYETWRSRKKEEAWDPTDRIFERRFTSKGRWAAPPRGPEQAALDGETMALIERCSEGLSFNQRAAFWLREVERAGTDEICKALDVTPTHLGVLLFRARNKLRECLEKSWGA